MPPFGGVDVLLRYLRQDRVLDLAGVVRTPGIAVILRKARSVVIVDGKLLPHSNRACDAHQHRAQRRSRFHGRYPYRYSDYVSSRGLAALLFGFTAIRFALAP